MHRHGKKGRQEVMKRKLLALALSLGLVAALPLTAGATAPSQSTGVTVAPGNSADYAVAPSGQAFAGERAPEAAVLEKITSFNSSTIDLSALVDADGESGVAQTAEQTEALQTALSGKTALTGVLDAYPINGGTPDANGNHKLTFHLPNLTRAATEVQILHYSMTRHLWELVPTEVDYDAKNVTGTFADLSPVVIVAKVAASGEGGSSSGSGSSAQGTSPKTGESTDFVMWIGAAVVLGAAAVLVKRPKKSAKQ